VKRTSREPSGIPARMRKSAWIVLAIPALALTAVFQNCSKVNFETASPSKASSDFEKESQFAELTAGDAKAFPPLKLVFVVDNSGTMQVNQINLASAFGKMFEGDNASNLAPFDSTAIVINTAQRSVASGDSIFSRLPNQAPESLALMPLSDLKAMRGGNMTDGKLAGDLVGYAAQTSVVNGLTTLSYLPSPVLGLNGTSMEMGVHKLSGGSVSEFARAFSERISVLDPARSMIDPATRRGILDPVVDQESGLCAVARVLKNNSGLINKGDLAAFVIVSDEDDADPRGQNCIDKYEESLGKDEFIDGHCLQPKTEFSYIKEIKDPSKAKCKVDYDTGISFAYNYNNVQTKVVYFKKRYQYSQARTNVSYKTSKYKYDIEKTDVSYWVKNPTYKVAQTKITYAKKVKSCDMRDGIEINCTYSYPTTSKTVDGTYSGSNCSSLAAGNLPSDALLNDPGHPLACEAAAARSVSGNCTGTEPNVLDCQQNFSQKTATLDGKFNGACDSFVAKNPPAGAILGDSSRKLVCADATVVSTLVDGRCPATGKPNCKETLSAFTAPAAKNGIADASTCAAFAKTHFGSVAGIVLDNAAASDLPQCSPASAEIVQKDGSCPSKLGVDQSSCVAINGVNTASKVYPGSLGSQTCAAFLAAQGTANQPADRSDRGEALDCKDASEAKKQEGTENFSSSVLVGYKPNAKDACSQALSDAVKAKYNLPAPTSCIVTGIATSSTTIQDLTCAEASPLKVCADSSGKYRDCRSTDIAAGAKYESTATLQTLNETLTCDTKCSDTKLCKDKTGTVGENYFTCKATALAPQQVTPFTKQLLSKKDSLCEAGQTLVQTKAPYREAGTFPRYVAGEKSEKNEPNALSNYIKERSTDLFGSTVPAVSVFVRQSGDALGQNGAVGTNYNTFANMMDGQKRSVLSNADSYASSLQSLGGVIRSKLERSFSISGVQPDQKVLRAWHRAAGAAEWVEAEEGTDWTASGGTVTVSETFDFKFGDQFRFEYK
jgi:hypothetical protein